MADLRETPEGGWKVEIANYDDSTSTVHYDFEPSPDVLAFIDRARNDGSSIRIFQEVEVKRYIWMEVQ